MLTSYNCGAAFLGNVYADGKKGDKLAEAVGQKILSKRLFYPRSVDGIRKNLQILAERPKI